MDTSTIAELKVTSDPSEDDLQLVVATTLIVHCFFTHLSGAVTSGNTVISSNRVGCCGRRKMVKLRVVATAGVRKGHLGGHGIISKCGRVYISLSKNRTALASSCLVDFDDCSSIGRTTGATSVQVGRRRPLPAGLPQPRPVSFKICLWVF